MNLIKEYVDKNLKDFKFYHHGYVHIKLRVIKNYETLDSVNYFIVIRNEYYDIDDAGKKLDQNERVLVSMIEKLEPSFQCFTDSDWFSHELTVTSNSFELRYRWRKESEEDEDFFGAHELIAYYIEENYKPNN
jgi:hypothetical protein